MLLTPKCCLLTTESWDTSDLLLFRFLIGFELGLPAWLLHASITRLKMGAVSSSHLAEGVLKANTLTNGSCSDFLMDVGGLGVHFIFILNACDYIPWALVTLILQLQR